MRTLTEWQGKPKSPQLVKGEPSLDNRLLDHVVSELLTASIWAQFQTPPSFGGGSQMPLNQKHLILYVSANLWMKKVRTLETVFGAALRCYSTSHHSND